MKLTAAYYRSSTKLQVESVANQRYDISQYALKKGLLIDLEYAEPSVSARTNKLVERPQMKRLMTDIRNGKIGTLLVYKRDRLARKVEEHLELHKLFKTHNVEVHFIAENEPPMRFDIFGELMELFIGVMNQKEAEQINLRIADTKISNFIRGKTIWNLPYGYSSDRKNTIIIRNEDELTIVKTIFNEWNTNKYKNMSMLAKKLSDDGIKRGNNNWTPGNILKLLTNPIYMGIRIATFDNRQVSRSVEELAVITVKEFDLAQEIIESRKSPMKPKEKFNYLLSSLIFCDVCEQTRLIEQEKTNKLIVRKPLINYKRTRNGEVYATYECNDHNIKLEQKETDNLIYLKAREFFSELLDTHFDKLYSTHLKKALVQLSKIKTNFTKELEDAEEKLVQATNKWTKKDSPSTKDKVLECSSKIKQIKNKIFDLEVKKQKYLEVPDLVDEIKKEILKEETWRLLPFARKSELMNDLIQEIFVDGLTIRTVFKHPYLETDEVVQ